MPQNPQDVIDQRRATVARLYLQGWTQQRIADQERVTRELISQDLTAIRKDWEASTLFDFNEAKIQELQKIDNLEAEAWRHFFESARPLKKKSTKLKGKAQQGQNSKLPNDLEQYTYEEERLPDPRFMQIVDRCIERRCRILGLEAPLKVAETDPQGKPVAPTGRAWVKVDFTSGRPVPRPDDDYPNG